MAEAVLSLQMGNKDLDQTKIDRITACFASYGLPTHVPVRAILTELFWCWMLTMRWRFGSSFRHAH